MRSSKCRLRRQQRSIHFVVRLSSTPTRPCGSVGSRADGAGHERADQHWDDRLPTGNAIRAGVGAAFASLRYDRAIASQRNSLAVIHDVFLERARERVAAQNIRIILGL